MAATAPATTLLKSLLANYPGARRQRIHTRLGCGLWGHEAQIGYFSGCRSDHRARSQQCIWYAAPLNPAVVEEIRGILGQMLFSGEEGAKPTKCTLRRRAGAPRVLQAYPHQTQHPHLRRAHQPPRPAINALNSQRYEGTVLLVTHDHDLIDEVATRLWNFKEDGIEDFQGPYSEWKALFMRTDKRPAPPNEGVGLSIWRRIMPAGARFHPQFWRISGASRRCSNASLRGWMRWWCSMSCCRHSSCRPQRNRRRIRVAVIRDEWLQPLPSHSRHDLWRQMNPVPQHRQEWMQRRAARRVPRTCPACPGPPAEFQGQPSPCGRRTIRPERSRCELPASCRLPAALARPSPASARARWAHESVP